MCHCLRESSSVTLPYENYLTQKAVSRMANKLKYLFPWVLKDVTKKLYPENSYVCVSVSCAIKMIFAHISCFTTDCPCGVRE